ncbi:MAG: hypothetical protein ACTSRK_04120 [Promethearchaeota archaeon]
MNREIYPSSKSIIPITYGFLLENKEFDAFLVSPELPRLYNEKSPILCIYALYPRLSRLTCYPVSTFRIFKLHLELTSSDLDLIGKITQVLQKFEIIHTTGLSEHALKYSVEYYISPRQKNETLESREHIKSIVIRLSQIANISLCVGEIITYQDHSQ